MYSGLTKIILSSAIEVHKHCGPGLLESSYEACLAHEFFMRGIEFEQQVPLPIVYKGKHLSCGYRLDFVVEKTVLLELKSQDSLLPVHTAQTLTYLKLSRLPVALLLNFNTPVLKDGIIRFINKNLSKNPMMDHPG
jgi:GxxExxY protein